MSRIIAMALFLSACGTSAPEPPPTTTAVASGCRDLCDRLHACDVADGRGDGATDCEAGCAPGGLYASVGDAYECALRPTCAEARECAAPALGVALLGSLGHIGAVTAAPTDWPAEFPTVPGGVSRTVPSIGPVHMALIGYTGREVAEIDHAYRDALEASGWTIADEPSSPEADRFRAAREGASVSVSIYREGNDTIVQTMQLAETRR